MLRGDASPRKLKWRDGQPPKWIPIEIGLPIENELVLVTTKAGYITTGYVSKHWEYHEDYDPDSGEEIGDMAPRYSLVTDSTGYLLAEPEYLEDGDIPIAWAYMPEPYMP